MLFGITVWDHGTTEYVVILEHGHLLYCNDRADYTTMRGGGGGEGGEATAARWGEWGGA